MKSERSIIDSCKKINGQDAVNKRKWDTPSKILFDDETVEKICAKFRGKRKTTLERGDIVLAFNKTSENNRLTYYYYVFSTLKERDYVATDCEELSPALEREGFNSDYAAFVE